MPSDKEEDKEAPEPAPEPESMPKKKRVGKKLTDKQKEDLSKHMTKMDMTVSEKRSHRMKLLAKMRQDPRMTAKKAHNMISK
tara:strand:+ start:1422 stop:1667 length:246 start_codon:yes stop_codon:yes gene_type:complete